MVCNAKNEDWSEKVRQVHAQMAVHALPFLPFRKQMTVRVDALTGIYLRLQKLPFLLTCEYVDRWQGFRAIRCQSSWNQR